MKAFYYDKKGVKRTCTEAEWQAKFGNGGATFPARFLTGAAAGSFSAPKDIVEGSPEARFSRHTCRFLGLPYDLADINRWRAWAAYKKWDYELQNAARAQAPPPS